MLLRQACLFGIFILGIGFSNPAQGQFFQGFEVQAGAELPYQIMGRVKADFPMNFYSAMGIGYAPGFLSTTNGSLLGGIGIVGKKTGAIAGEALSGSIVIDLKGGWRLNGSLGFFVEGGLSFTRGGSGQSNVDEAEIATGESYSSAPLDTPLTVESTITSLTVHGGYTWQVFSPGWNLSAVAGLIKPLTSSTTVTVDENISSTTERRIIEDLEGHMNDAFKSSLIILTAGAWMSYSF